MNTRTTLEQKKKAFEALTDILRDQGSADSPQKELPRRAAKAQKDATAAKNAAIRSAALLALARLGLPEALDIIAEHARTDPDLGVRRTAVLALGLLGTPEAEKVLLEDREIGDKAEDVRTAALGLVRDLSRDSSDRLQATVQTKDANQGSIATWGLQSQADRRAGRLFGKILDTSPSCWMASDAILFLGRSKQYDAIPLLSQLLLAGPDAQQIAAYRTMDIARNMVSAKRALRDPMQQQQATNNLQNLQRSLNTPQPPVPGNSVPPPIQNPTQPPAPPVVAGIEQTYIAELRGSAAMALGMLDDPRSRGALLQALDLPDNEYSELYKGPALISLGQVGDEPCLRALVAVLSRGALSSPLRSYAAIGLGLYARSDHLEQEEPPATRPSEIDQRTATRPAFGAKDRIPTTRPAPQPKDRVPTPPKAPKAKEKLPNDRQKEQEDEPQEDRPGYRRAMMALSECLANPKDTPEIHTACALALGLTQRKEALAPLQAVKEPSRNTPLTLVGYSLLARGMLRDKTLIGPARKLLATTSKKEDTNSILAQRAAILGLGLLDDQDAIPILQDAWNLNYYASREVILALSLSRSTNAGEVLLDLLKNSKNPMERAYISFCIGEVFAKEQPSPLYHFTGDTNYMMKNENLLPFQSLVNEFLFNYLLGAFGGSWK